MKIVLRLMIFVCIFFDIACMIISDLMFNIRAAGLVFAAICATIGMYECIKSLNDIYDVEDATNDDEN